MYDAVALGELLIDFTPAGISSNECSLFEQNPGGAPANVLGVLAKLNMKTEFIGKVGRDQFGYFLKDVLENIQVGTRNLVFDDEANTTLAFVHLDDNGDRKFSFYRNPGADMMLREEDIDFNIIDNAKVFHFGSVSMTHEPARSTTLKAVEYAKAKKVLVSYDPNYRPLLWKNADEAKQYMEKGLAYADILKVSEEELQLLTDITDIEQAVRYLEIKYNIPLIVVTLGDKGSYFKKSDYEAYVPSYKVKAVDTTGAGDGFLGGLLYQILTSEKNIHDIQGIEFKKMIGFANAIGALMTTKRGAIPAIPALKEIEEFIDNNINE
ncbi:carbohydrate kinase [Defluviitalea saccharophila]|uniref:Carbohydrate kinase n=1 Tax=Defluviitalea saccharophila TaxID=879970 RepID=A0ABZ2Y7F5_9FIRM